VAKRTVVTGTFDIECQDWDKYVTGGCFDGKRFHCFRRMADLYDFLVTSGGTWWGHYSGAYDMLAILAEHSARNGEEVQLFMSGSRITCAKFKSGLVLRDTFALAPISLKKFATLAGLEKTDTGLPCICGESCAGYCAIRVNMSEREYKLVEEYLEVDCRVLYAAFDVWLNKLRTYFGEPSGTVGASSFRFSGQEKAKWDSRLYSFARLGYYGGRTEVWKRDSASGWHDDINSAYVDALRLPMPVGNPRESYFSIPIQAKFWIAEAVVKVPPMHIPPLPYRRNNRLYFPTETIDFGVWNKIELDNAEACGAKIIKLGRILSWDAMEPVYDDYCNKGWNIRASVGKNTTEGKLLKQVLVSLAGKLAQKPEVKEIKYSSTPVIGWTAVDARNRFWSRETFKISHCAHVHHAGLMTAYVRTRIQRRGMKAAEGAVYCDTDSVFSEKYIPDELGDELGQFQPSGPDGRYSNLRAYAPKVYEYTEGGETDYKAKGFSLGSDPGMVAARFRQVVRGEEIENNRGVLPLKKAIRMRESLFTRKIESRRFQAGNSRWIGGRLKVGESATRPPTFGEIATDER